MATMKKILAISVILIVLLASFYLVATAYKVDEFEEGAPVGTLTIFVSDGTHVYSGEILIDEFTPEATIFRQITPLTTYSQDLVGIGNTTHYDIGFELVGVVSPEEGVNISAGEQLSSLMQIWGNSGTGYDGTIYPFQYDNGAGARTQQLSGGSQTTADTPFTLTTQNPFNFVSWYGGDGIGIPGINLDGSEYTIEILTKDVATGGLQFYGKTTLTLAFDVDWDGNLTTTITSISGVVE